VLDTVTDSASRGWVGHRLVTLATGAGAALAAFLFYGGWAYWVNRQHGVAIGGKAWLTQGSASFATTFLLARLAEYFSARFATPRTRLALAPLLSTSTVACALLAVHLAAGTPAVLATIAPSVAFGFVYTAYVTYLSSRR